MESSGDQLFIDSTFDVCPENVEQMLSVLVKKREWTKGVSVMYCFLQRKQESTYINLLQHMVRLAPSLTAVASLPISVDFEKAMQNAIQTVLPNAQIVGCFFHLKQAIIRYATKGNAGKTVMVDMKDKKLRDELSEKLTALVDAATVDDFEKER